MRRYTRMDIKGLAEKLQETTDHAGYFQFTDKKNECEKDPYIFGAILCNLGLFGVIYSITFETKPMYTLDSKSCHE